MISGDSYDLTKFDQIRDFSWVGLRSKADFEAMKACFITNAKHLETLKLETFEWIQDFNRYLGFTDDTNHNYDFFMEEILGSSMKSSNVNDSIRFPVLQDLYLGHFYIYKSPKDFASTFNMFSLKRLALWNCLGSVPLLEHLMTQDIQLVSLEISCKLSNEDHEGLEPVLSQFLQKHTGLQDIFLNLGVLKWWDIVASVCTHLETLNRVVLHAQGTNFELDLYHLQEEDQAIETNSSVFDLFTNGACDFVAMSNPPRVLVSNNTIAGPLDSANLNGTQRELFEQQVEDVSCKMLHLRASEYCLKREDSHSYVTRNEVNSFADWVFGPEGFPKLLVFAYGDFAFENSCRGYNVLYCRNNLVGKDEGDPCYRVLTPDDKELWDWVTANKDALSCCPYETLLGW